MKYFYYLFFLLFFTSYIKADEKAQKACALPGDSAGGSLLGAIGCCKGYITTNQWLFEQHKKSGCVNVPPPPGSSGSCIKCGDNVCDKKNFEDKCSCTQDCKI